MLCKEGLVISLIVLKIFIYAEGASPSPVMVGKFTKKAEAEALLPRKSPFPPMVARNASLAGNSVLLLGRSLRGKYYPSFGTESGPAEA